MSYVEILINFTAIGAYSFLLIEQAPEILEISTGN